MNQTHPLTHIQQRIEACTAAVEAITICAKLNPGMDGTELLALAHRITRCSHPSNYFIAKEAVNFDTGEEYDSTGTHWRCNSKMCSNCIAIFSRNNRRKLRNAINKQKLRKGEKWYFPTLTIPNPNLSLVATREIVNYAWSLMRKKSLCVSLIRGGAKSEEFTLTINGYHYHIHALLIAQRIEYNAYRQEWTKSVKAAFRKFEIMHIWKDHLKRRIRANREWNLANPDKKRRTDLNLWIKFQPITNLDRLPFELCKYITKSDSWSKMRPQDLTEVCLVRKWWRMFELFGCMAARETSDIAIKPQDTVDSIIVHTKSLTDEATESMSDRFAPNEPTHTEKWRDKLNTMSLADYKIHVDREVWKAIRFRTIQIRMRWPQATLFDGNGDEVLREKNEPKADWNCTVATLLHDETDG